MQLISVNTSLPQKVEYKQQSVSTGIFKQPVSGEIFVDHDNLAGDQQADLEHHGGLHKAVYAFSANEYRYWQNELGIELPYGKFGENLTIHALSESALCIGDRLQINDCILEITQPRVPCFKLGMVFNDPQFPNRFIAHAASGIYFKVIQTGVIQAGDEVNIIHRDAAGLSVRTLFQAYFEPHFPDAKRIMHIAAGIEALSDEWRKKVIARINQK